MSASRDVAWDGFFNARDLGGLPTRGGRSTRFGAFFRSADLRFVTTAGWQAAREAGVRTVIDLRNEDEVASDAMSTSTDPMGSARFAPAAAVPDGPGDMDRLHVPVDGVDDTEMWRYLNEEKLNGTPLYYLPFLARKADRCAAVITAIAGTAPGGVLFHCGAGRDRTGLVALLLLALADVEPVAIAEDYQLTVEPLRALFAAMGRRDEQPSIERILAEKGTTVHTAILATLEDMDVEAYLRSAGVTDTDLAAIRGRLLS